MYSLFALMFGQLDKVLKESINGRQNGLAQQTQLESSQAQLNVNAENDTEMHNAI